MFCGVASSGVFLHAKKKSNQSWFCDALNTRHSSSCFLSNWPRLFFPCSPFWRENSSLLCPALANVTFHRTCDHIRPLLRRVLGLPTSHTYTSKPSSFSGRGFFFSFEPLFHSSSLFFWFSVGRIKETFSVWRGACNFLRDLPGTQQTTRLLGQLCVCVCEC